MVAGQHLGLEMPRLVSDRANRPLHAELAGIAKGRGPSWIRSHDDVDADGLSNGAERVQLNVRIATLHPPHRVR